MKNHKRTILKTIIGVMLALIILVLSLFAYSEKVHKIGFIENAKNSILQLVNGNDGISVQSEATVIDITGIIPAPESEHEHIYKTLYDENKHWEECSVCGVKRNEITHAFTTTWGLGYESCILSNSYTKTCSCGYSEIGHKPCVWNGRAYMQSGNYRHGRLCSICKNEIYHSYYLYSYENGAIYNAEYDNKYACLDQKWRETCRKADGSPISCTNLGTCIVCSKNFSEVNHVLLTNQETREIYCQICNAKFGKCIQTVTRDPNVEGRYTFVSNITLNNGATIKDYRNLDYQDNATFVKISEKCEGLPTSAVLTTVVQFKSGYSKPAYIISPSLWLEINGHTTTMYTTNISPGVKLYPDVTEPVINNVNIEDSSKWNKSKQISISGTENYCDVVSIKIENDSGRVIYEGSANVTNNNWSVSCTPEIEAGESGRTYKVTVTDTCENSITSTFDISKVDAIPPNVTSNDKVTDSEWAREKSFTFTAEDLGIGNVEIGFNDINDYSLATKDETNYSKEYKFVGDAYSPVQASVYFKDGLGNITTQLVTLEKIDNTGPTITNASFDNNKLKVEAHDRHETLGEGSGVTKYRYVTSTTKLSNPVVSQADSIEVNVGEDIVISDINTVKYVYVVAEDLVGNISNVYEVEVPQLLLTSEVNIEAANGKGGVDLDWSTYDPTNKVFKAYQKKEGSDEFESISTVDFYNEIEPIKVLNVYPISDTFVIPTVTFKYLDGTSENLPKSAALKVWMEGGSMTENNSTTNFETYGKNPYTGQKIIEVNPVSITDFNKTPEIIWDYDVVMFGTWDGNASNGARTTNVPNDNAIEQLEKYIEAGYGILTGHDTIGYSYYNKGISRLRKYFNIETGFFGSSKPGVGEIDRNEQWAYGSTIVKVTKQGTITNFPYQLSNKIQLTIPFSHTTSNAALGNTWIEFIDGENGALLPGQSNGSAYFVENYKGNGNPKYYLTTWNNTAMIQTGSSNCETTEDERKILANTLFYLKQRTSDTGFTDNSAQDLKAPNAPDMSVQGLPATNNLQLTLNSEDNGNEYTYYVEAYDSSDASLLLATSNQTTETVTTGTKGYYYIIDNNSSNTDFDISTATYIDTDNFNVGLENNGKYIHMKAIDRAGNISDPSVQRIELKVQMTVDLDGGTLNGEDEVTLEPGLAGSTIDLGTPVKEGYTFDGWTETEGTVNGTKYTYGLEEGTITATWSKNSYNYTVEYYYNGTKDNSKTETASAEFESIIETYLPKADAGYKFDRTENIPLTISSNTKNNVIRVYYVTDDNQIKNLSYTVEYYKEGEKVNADTQKVTQTVQYLEPDILTVDKTQINTIDKYVGYKLGEIKINGVTVRNITSTVNNEDVIEIHYVIDDSQTKDLSYIVQYYISGNKQEKDTQVETQTVQILQPDILTVDKTKINTTNKYIGYKLEKIEIEETNTNADAVGATSSRPITPEIIPDTINNNGIIRVYYIIDDDQTKDISYTVEYYKDDEKVDTDIETQTVQVLEPDVLTVDKSKINTTNKYDGYRFESTDPETIPNTINNGETIKIYYTKRTDLTYKVNYLEKGTDRVLETQKLVENQTFGDKIDTTTEIITINGFKYDSVDKPELEITTGENVINIYYTKVTGLSYTVKYLEKDTDRILKEPKTVEGQTFENEILARDEIIDINGFNYNSSDKDKIVIGTAANELTLYYTKRNDLSYKVTYTDKDTGEEIHPPKVVEDKTFEEVVEEIDEVIEIDGYVPEDPGDREIEIGTDDNVINITYKKRTDLTYVINYLEKGTNEEIKDQKKVENQTFKDEITSSNEVVDIYGYNYDSISPERLPITTGENIINIYYTKKDTKVTVHYYEENTTNKLSEDVVISGKVFDKYETELAEDIPSKYELIETPENSTGEMTEEEIVVTYYYRKKATQVIVHYYEEGTTNKLSENVVINGRVDDSYTTVAATDVPIKWELVSEPSNKNGLMTEETIEVIYFYRVKDTQLIIKYLEKDTNIELAQEERQNGKVEEDYITEEKQIENYTLVGHTGNTTGKLTIEPITVIFYYLQNTKVTVNHIDKNTGETLEKVTVTGLVGDKYTANSKNIENYVLSEKPEQENVVMGKNEIILNYYYVHVSAGLIEKHIDVITGNVLYNEVHTGNEGDKYSIQSKTFDGYEVVEDRLPSNATGTMAINTIEVTYYYIYRSKVTAEYIDRATGAKLTADVVQNGHEDDSYTTERKQFDNYELITIPNNADGKMTKDPITATYIYAHHSEGVKIKYVDGITGEVIEEKVIEGNEGDSYKTEPGNIPGYDVVKEKLPTNSESEMTIEETEVIYYYIKKTNVTVKHIDKVTGQEIAAEEVINGHENDQYTAIDKVISGYDLVETPDNSEGKMTKEPIEVVYYYARPAEVIVNYIDKDTNKEIIKEEIIKGHEGDSYKAEEKEMKYYYLDEDNYPTNKEGIMNVSVVGDKVDNKTYVNYYYKQMKFSLKLEKELSGVSVNGQTTNVNGNFGKVEIHRKEIGTAKVKIHYTIKVHNNGELAGKATILEKIPAGTAMSKASNPMWNVSNSTATLETDEIKPGETKEYTVILDWVNGDNNLGTKSNSIEVLNTENEAGFEASDIDVSSGTADIIISVGTGESTYIIFAGIGLLVLITTGTILIKKYRK